MKERWFRFTCDLCEEPHYFSPNEELAVVKAKNDGWKIYGQHNRHAVCPSCLSLGYPDREHQAEQQP